MDPIRTAVKYSLIPLRVIVDVGDRYVSKGEQADEAMPEAAAPRKTRARPRRAAAKQASRRAARPSPQASRAPKDLDDVALARKVETIIFRDATVPKGHIDVNAADGVVWLRGEAKTPDMIKMLERQAAQIPEVRQVENLLHLPKTPAPTRTDTPPTQRRTRSSTKRPTPEKVTTGVTNERRTTQGEPLPEELAREGEGRPPSPLGAGGGGSESGT
jgi:BON domain-containing protein